MDPAYGRAPRDAHRAGVSIRPPGCTVGPEGVRLAPSLGASLTVRGSR
ncbi:MAG: hypothetical protein FJ098_03080 [Deltaproteobacteria bacterium]|nr:hypothetical protein [Deltaproteobacteria bacterium]